MGYCELVVWTPAKQKAEQRQLEPLACLCCWKKLWSVLMLSRKIVHSPLHPIESCSGLGLRMSAGTYIVCVDLHESML